MSAQAAHVIAKSKSTGPMFDLLGPTVEFLTPLSAEAGGYCMLRGTLPPGALVPIHSHPDDESMYMLSGTVQLLAEQREGFEWVDLSAGDFVHLPGGVKHAWRNVSSEPVVQVITTTPRLGRFFQEIGKPVVPGAPPVPPSAEEIQRFTQTAARYDHWVGTPADNAAVGIRLPGVPS